MAELLSLQSTVSADSAAFVRGIENCRGGLRNLIASLDPAAQATMRFNRNMETLDRALKQGKISADDYGLYVSRLRGRMNEAAGGQQNLTASAGQLRSGMQQLSYQIGDVTQGFAMGTPVMTIFAQQSGQVIQAMSLMTNSSKGLIGFLAGPWGAVMTGAITILGAMIMNHRKAADGQDEHTKATNALKQATERLKNESASANRETRQGIVDSINAANATRQETVEKLRLAQATLRQREAARDSAMQSSEMGSDTALAMLAYMADRARAEIKSLDAEIGTYSKVITLDRVKLAMRDIAGETSATTKATQDYEDSIDRVKRKFEAGGFGSPDTAQADAAFRAQIRQATLARDAAMEAIREAERAETAAQRSGDSAAKRAAADAKKQAREAAREAERLAKDAEKSTEQLKQRAEATWASVFPSQERLRSLYDQMRSLDDAMAAQLIEPGRWNGAKARLNEEISLLREQIRKENESFKIIGEGDRATVLRSLTIPDGPDIKMVSKDISEQMKGVAQSAADAGAAFVRMSEQSLNSLSNLANSIKSGNILNILADTLNMFASLSQMGLFGKGLQANFKGFSGVSGFRADGGPVGGGKTYVVGERGPELFTPDRSGYIIPNGANDNGGGRGGAPVMHFDLRGAVMTEHLLGQMNAMADAAAVRGAMGGSTMALENSARRASRRIPGR
jgi:hypothetical protein